MFIILLCLYSYLTNIFSFLGFHWNYQPGHMFGSFYSNVVSHLYKVLVELLAYTCIIFISDRLGKLSLITKYFNGVFAITKKNYSWILTL